MSEFDGERRIEAAIEQRIEVKAGYSPHWNRLAHKSATELDQESRADAEEDRLRFNRERDCRCYPRGLASMTREDRDELKRLHIEAGYHRMACPLWRDPDPMYSRRGDSIPPSYTLRQQRQDAEAEALDG
jgi:hypothetical protein